MSEARQMTLHPLLSWGIDGTFMAPHWHALQDYGGTVQMGYRSG